MKTKSQILADTYLGSHQILASIYKDEAILYAQVTGDTAAKILSALVSSRHLVLREAPGMSADGMTWCYLLARSKEHPAFGDWLSIAMTSIFLALQLTVSHLFTSEGSVMYVDCRQLDLTTIDLFFTAVAPTR